MLTHSPAVSTYAQYYKILLKTIDTLLCDSLMTMLSWITTTEDDNFISLLPCSPALSFVLWEWGTWWWDGADDFDMKFELRLIFFQVERCLSASPLSRLQSVCTHGSEFTYRWAHSRIKFVFVDHDYKHTLLSGPVWCICNGYKWDPRALCDLILQKNVFYYPDKLVTNAYLQ